MLLSHFHALRPHCLVCRSASLVLSTVEAEAAGDILAGILGCPACGAEYPILDGLPILVSDVRRFVEANLFYLMSRPEALPPRLDSLLGDAAGPASALASLRQHLSSYAWDHWGSFDPEERADAGEPVPGGVARVLADGLARLQPAVPGAVLDLGCGPARSTAELAAALPDRPVLGIELSVPLARLGRRALLEGRVDYGRRHLGTVYDRRSFAIPAPPRGAADLWICDIAALPFADGTVALSVGLNVVDCLPDPRAGLAELGRVAAPGGQALLTVPFDWSPAVTPPEHWIGGHSQRGPHAGRAEPLLAALLADGPLAAGALRLAGAAWEVPWQVRVHDRSLVQYRAHAVRAMRPADATRAQVLAGAAAPDSGEPAAVPPPAAAPTH